MTERILTSGFTATGRHPLIGIVIEEDEGEIVHYFTEVEGMNTAETEDDIEAALSMIGIWRDLDWTATLNALDRIRHESQPTPPIDDL